MVHHDLRQKSSEKHLRNALFFTNHSNFLVISTFQATVACMELIPFSGTFSLGFLPCLEFFSRYWYMICSLGHGIYQSVKSGQ